MKLPNQTYLFIVLLTFVIKSSVNVRVVNQLLTEMDGLEARKKVFIMGATNRPGELVVSFYEEEIVPGWPGQSLLSPTPTPYMPSCPLYTKNSFCLAKGHRGVSPLSSLGFHLINSQILATIIERNSWLKVGGS